MDPIEEEYKELKADMDKKNKAISEIKGVTNMFNLVN